MVNTLVRITAILLVKRFFGLVRVTWLLLVLAVLYGVVVLLEIFLICRPLAVDWNVYVHGTCGDQVMSYLVLEVLGLFLDFIILAVPIPCIWQLDVKLAQKMSVATIFSIGFL